MSARNKKDNFFSLLRRVFPNKLAVGAFSSFMFFVFFLCVYSPSRLSGPSLCLVLGLICGEVVLGQRLDFQRGRSRVKKKSRKRTHSSGGTKDIHVEEVCEACVGCIAFDEEKTANWFRARSKRWDAIWYIACFLPLACAAALLSFGESAEAKTKLCENRFESWIGRRIPFQFITPLTICETFAACTVTHSHTDIPKSEDLQ